MTINIEITSTPDTRLLADIHTSCFGKGWDGQTIQDLLTVIGSIAFVAEQGRGFALLRLLGEEAEILTLAVRETYRRQGMANALVDAMLSYGQARGARHFFLEVRESNSAAQALYGRHGFIPLSRRKDYYHNPDGTSEDAIVMRYQR